MIAALLAAVIAQPLDAESVSATRQGVAVSVHHPSTWKPKPITSPDSVARLVDPSGTQECRIWISDELAAFPSGGRSSSPEFRYLDSGAFERRYAGAKISVISAATVVADGLPLRIVEFDAPGADRQVFAGCIVQQRVVLMLVGGKRYDDNRDMFLSMAHSLRVRAERQPWPWGCLAAAVGVVLVVVASHRIIRSRRRGV